MRVSNTLFNKLCHQVNKEIIISNRKHDLVVQVVKRQFITTHLLQIELKRLELDSLF